MLLSEERKRLLMYGGAGLLIVVLLGVLLAWVFPAWLTMRPSSGMTAAQHRWGSSCSIAADGSRHGI